MHIMDPQQLDAFLASYLAMWHEQDAARRHALIHELWASDAENITRSFTAAGIGQIVQRVDRAHAEWVSRQDFVFRPCGTADAHNNLVRFSWEMLPRAGGAIEAKGLDILVLNTTGKIRSLYQFAEPLPA